MELFCVTNHDDLSRSGRWINPLRVLDIVEDENGVTRIYMTGWTLRDSIIADEPLPEVVRRCNAAMNT